ncbi:phosphotransferase [Streptomyces sp. XD-27]|uniref:phosphotransferase n=1 Tax=Streptomyces sp. XD-27 TaxID=3062779 RepID=UPI0026F45E61|nr:phosphotransferase [Streptomyces sp. XD-27]WKX71442.1 phosphotransferase [Streptomyces sp. XD-27]
MPRSPVPLAETSPPDGTTLHTLLRRYDIPGEPLSCEPLAQGLLNRGYRLATTRGRYFLKHHLDGDRAAIARQHRVTLRLDALGLPVAPPVADTDGRTVTVIDGRCWALHPWIDGQHRDGGELTRIQSARLGALLGLVHTCLEEVIDPRTPAPRAPHAPDEAGADPAHTFALIDRLLALARARRGHDAFDELAVHRLVERRELLERHAHRRPAAAAVPATGWVHGDFHPLNLLYRDAEPAAIVDWDRLGVQPRAEEAVRAAAIFFVRPGGTLELAKVRAYARAYRRTTGAGPAELAAAAHRVWWERLNDFWMLRWRYQLGDRRADHQFPAAAALAVWWTREYDAVREAFAN